MSDITFTPKQGDSLTKLLLQYAQSNCYSDDGVQTPVEWKTALSQVESLGIVTNADTIFAGKDIHFTQEQMDDVLNKLGFTKDGQTPKANNAGEGYTTDAIEVPNVEPIALAQDSVPWPQLKNQYEDINRLSSNKERVIEYYKRFGDESGENYVLVDKENATLEVRKPNGEVVRTFEVGLGEQKGDAYLTRYRKMTTAGIYTIDAQGTGQDAYAKKYGDDIFTMTTDKGATGVAIHRIPKGNNARAPKMHNGTIADNRYSTGCVNLLPNEMEELEGLIGVGTKVIILPEDSGNDITIKNGQLNLTQDNFTGDVMTSLPCVGATPIDIEFEESAYVNEASTEFANTLASKKTQLMADIGIDNDTYNDLAHLSLGIAGQESEYGEGVKYWLKENTPAVNVGKWFKRQWGHTQNFFSSGSGDKNLQEGRSFNSRGLTQMKVNAYTDEQTQALFEQYGITPDNLGDPKNSAIATMIVLGSMHKNELPALKEDIKQLGISNTDALLYLWQGRKSQITGRLATPDKSNYVTNVRKYQNGFNLGQSVTNENETLLASL